MIASRAETARKAREMHQQSIQRSLEHRLKVAIAKGDEHLIRQLQAEMKYLR